MHSISKLLAGSIVAFGAAWTVAADVKFAGVNIAGFDFGCSTDVRTPPFSSFPLPASAILNPDHRAPAPLPLSFHPSSNTAATMALPR